MIKAIDENGKSVLISNAIRGKVYYCPACNYPLEQRKGEERQYFAHHRTGVNKDKHICCDSWNYDMSDWHINWQERFPEQCIEKIISYDNQKHRADVAINDLIIEFQHSNISYFDFHSRNQFYQNCGYSVIWVFDIRQDVHEKRVYHEDGNKFTWSHANKMFQSLDLKKENITLYFQFTDGEDDYCLERITGGYRNFSIFYTDTQNSLSIAEFVDLAKKEKSPLAQNNNKRTKQIHPDINDGKSIPELWNPNYLSFVVINLTNGEEIYIPCKDDKLQRQYNNPQGPIFGKKTAKNPDGSYCYSNLYPIKDAEKPIWRLKTKKPKQIQKINGCSSLEELIKSNPEETYFFCELNQKAYLLFFNNDNKLQFTAHEINQNNGSVIKTSTDFVFEKKNDIIWRLL